jgi:hypothetical protein
VSPLSSAIGYLLSGDAHPLSGRKVALDSERNARGLQVVSEPRARIGIEPRVTRSPLRIFSTRFTSKTQRSGQMDNILAMLLAVVLLASTVIIHYEMLRVTARLAPELSIPTRFRVLIVIAGVLLSHILEVCLYAVVYMLMQLHFGLGSVAGEFSGGPMDFFYFSVTTYTTLGVGDLFPTGPLRIVAGVEALNGFVLLGWSASFTYLSMEKFWGEDRRTPILS